MFILSVAATPVIELPSPINAVAVKLPSIFWFPTELRASAILKLSNITKSRVSSRLAAERRVTVAPSLAVKSLPCIKRTPFL